LIFFFTASAVLLRLQRVRVRYALNLVVPAVLITHFIARLGCSLTGCCWGIEVTLFGISFPFPVRELEAIFALVLFLILRRHAFNKRFHIYIIAYPTFRFFAEFLRADDRGSLFGISTPSPTAMVAGLIAVVAGLVWVARPAMRALGKEHWLDRLKAAFIPKPQAGRVPYTPDAFNYAGPVKSHPMKWIVSGVAMLTACSVLFIYLNPLSLAWCDDARFAMNDVFGFVFEEGSTKNVIGDTSGTTLTDLSGEGVIKDLKGALEVAKKKDAWASLELGAGKLEKLPGGNHLYRFSQLVDGLPVLGRSRVVVTDQQHNALFMAGDAAEFSYSDQKLTKVPSTGKTLQDIFGSKLSIKSSTKGWYDSGEGLVPATQVVIEDESGEAALGAVVQDADQTILDLTPPESDAVTTDEGNAVLTGAENVLEELEKPAEEPSEEPPAESNPLTEDRLQIEEAIREAQEESEAEPEAWRDALKGSVQIGRRVPGLNKQLFGRLLAAELESTMVNGGADPEDAADSRAEVEEAFDDNGLAPTADEPATEIVAQARRSDFRYRLNSNADRDVFSLVGQPNHATELTVSTAAPVTVQVSGADGRAIVDMYVNESETISLYPEDGESFVVQVSGQGNAFAPVSGAGYGVAVKAVSEEERIPMGVSTLFYRTEDYYDRSNLSAFLGMIALEEAGVMMEEALALGVLSSAADSCAGCMGMENGVDTAKMAIATLLIPEEYHTDELQFLKGSELSLDYFHHVETETGMIVKARLVVELDGLALYDGFTFIELTSGEYLEAAALPETGDAELDQALNAMMDTATDLSYYISEINADELYAAFGDSPGNVSNNKDVQSLYALWENYEEKNGGAFLWFKTFDKEEALKYHSAEKVHAFEVYTARYNLMQTMQQRAMLIIRLSTPSTTTPVSASAVRKCSALFCVFSLIS
ncbi:MAG: prolipoprotein diacylglyceryl transferase, partial [Clostridia bacterium]|nr:prolipoprotein diacylglyceryl transferase [Clostridia bacterium]